MPLPLQSDLQLGTRLYECLGCCAETNGLDLESVRPIVEFAGGSTLVTVVSKIRLSSSSAPRRRTARNLRSRCGDRADGFR
jgi:hypothetical protein